MDFNAIYTSLRFFWTPGTFAILSALTVLFFWIAVSPSKEQRIQDGRLDQYRQQRDLIEEADFQRSFWSRAIVPGIRSFLRVLAKLTPKYNIDRLQTTLLHAGEPGKLTPTDILGLQILCAIFPVAGYLLLLQTTGQLAFTPIILIIRNCLAMGVIFYFTPRVWLRAVVDRRKQEIVFSFSDALDLLSVSVEAGLGFDSALVKVSEQWKNALTKEFNRAVLEMRVGTPRNVALQRMGERTGVQEVKTFVGVLIQSSELGVSIAEVLHVQAEEVRLRRRQRAEELGRQASIKMVFALVLLIFPALLVVLLGPGVPAIVEALNTMSGG